jgi:hypothetical protein
VEPQVDEVLLSWLLRLATRLQVSQHALVRAGFWIDDRREQAQWWRRPPPQMLSRLSTRTGISTERLRAMTFERWSLYRDDEANERFSVQRLQSHARQSRGFRFALCEQCLDAQAEPHLHMLWAIGWVALCPQHATILTARCQKCSAKLRIGRPSSTARFSPQACVQCGNDLRYNLPQPAHPSVIRLQRALLEAKQEGQADFAGIGRLSWREVVALADVLIGMFWTDTTPVERQEMHAHFKKECDLSETQPVNPRYGDLAFFAWLTEDWPHGARTQIAMDMLTRWLSNKPNRIFRHLGVDWSQPWNPGTHDIPEDIRQRFRQLLEAPHAPLT